MRKRPFLLILCALSFLYFPGELLWRAHHSELIRIGDIIFSFFFPLLLLVGLIRVVKIGWYSLIAFAAVWGVRDLYYYYSSQGTSLTPIFIHLAIYLMSLAYFINPRVRHLYFDPKLRWWRTKPRYETYGPTIVKTKREWDYPIMRNISEGGCFIETANLLDLNDVVNLSIPLTEPLNVSVIKARGEVRWRQQSAERQGMGIQFMDMEKKYRKAVNAYVRRQL